MDECDAFPEATSILSAEVEKTSADPVRPSEPIQLMDPLLYIYTSGTTGLPKAAIMTHFRLALVIINLSRIKFRTFLWTILQNKSAS